MNKTTKYIIIIVIILAILAIPYFLFSWGFSKLPWWERLIVGDPTFFM